MTTLDRKAKVTPETKQESARLKALWDAMTPRPSQAEFGETFGIGNQSAVSQFLNGKTPLSLNAARCFAIGLGCSIDDFSPRLAAVAEAIADMVPGEPLKPKVARVAAAINSLNDKQIEFVLESIAPTIEFAKKNIGMTAEAPAASSKRIRRAG